MLQQPRRWDRLVALAAGYGAALPAEPDARALDEFLAARRAAEPGRFDDLSLAVVKLLGSGAYAAARGRRAAGRALRARGQRLRAFDRAEPPLRRPRDAAPA